MGSSAGLGVDPSADPSAGAGFRIVGSHRLMHSDDGGHAKIILINYYYYYYYMNSWRMQSISNYMTLPARVSPFTCH